MRLNFGLFSGFPKSRLQWIVDLRQPLRELLAMADLSEVYWNGFRLLLFVGDAISDQIRSGKSWEPHFIEIVDRLVEKGSTVCDAGANFGIHSLYLARHVGKTGKVFSFEPQPTIFQQLCFHLFLNQATNVFAYPFATAAGYGKTQIGSFSELLPFNLGATPVGSGEIRVDLVPLDHYSAEKFTFIKLDVQGCELSSLKGAKGIIARDRPVLFVEIEEGWLRRLGTSSKGLIDYIFSIGYALLRIDNNYPCDHLCVPIEKLESTQSLMAGAEMKTTTLQGSSIELTFTDMPYYSDFKIIP